MSTFSPYTPPARFGVIGGNVWIKGAATCGDSTAEGRRGAGQGGIFSRFGGGSRVYDETVKLFPRDVFGFTRRYLPHICSLLKVWRVDTR